MKKIKLIIVSILSFIFSGRVFSDEVEDKDLDELQKSLESELEEMEALFKSDSGDETVSDLLKTKEGREKLKKMALEADEDDETDEDEDDDEDEENEDEGYMKGKKNKNAMKKSFDDLFFENAEVIDANDVLKSFVDVLGKVVNSQEKLIKSISGVNERIESNEKLIKSLGTTVSSASRLIKSTSEIVEEIGNVPVETKGNIDQLSLLEKSFGENSGKSKKVTIAEADQCLMKHLEKAKEEKNNDLIKSIGDSIVFWEQNGYRFDCLPKNIQKELIEK